MKLYCIVKREKGPYVCGLIDAHIWIKADDILIDDIIFYPYRKLKSKNDLKDVDEFSPLLAWLSTHPVLNKLSYFKLCPTLAAILKSFMNGDVGGKCTHIWVNKKSVLFNY